jgi:hypothetical protein
MTPVLFPFDTADLRAAHAESRRDIIVTAGERSYSQDFSFGKFVLCYPFADSERAGNSAIFSVHGARAVIKVFGTVIVSVAIQVTTFHACGTGTEKSG